MYACSPRSAHAQVKITAVRGIKYLSFGISFISPFRCFTFCPSEPCRIESQFCVTSANLGAGRSRKGRGGGEGGVHILARAGEMCFYQSLPSQARQQLQCKCNSSINSSIKHDHQHGSTLLAKRRAMRRLHRRNQQRSTPCQRLTRPGSLPQHQSHTRGTSARILLALSSPLAMARRWKAVGS